MRLLTLSVFVLATLTGSETAMAFNCSGITLPSSIVICSDPDLTRLADERQQIYNEARSRLTPDQQNALWEDQKAWVRSYAIACGVARDNPPPIPAPPSMIECFKRSALTAAKTVKIPGPDHPITIERNPARVVVTVAGRIVADTREALTLHEAHYPAAQYIPRKDVDMTLLARTDHTTYCPYKGDCAYFSIPLGGERATNAVWSYEAPYAAVAVIKDHLAFYPDRVDAIEERPGA